MIYFEMPIEVIGDANERTIVERLRGGDEDLRQRGFEIGNPPLGCITRYVDKETQIEFFGRFSEIRLGGTPAKASLYFFRRDVTADELARIHSHPHQTEPYFLPFFVWEVARDLVHVTLPEGGGIPMAYIGVPMMTRIRE